MSVPDGMVVIQYAIDSNITHKKLESFEIIQGKGARGLIDEKKYWLGSHKFLGSGELGKRCCATD